MAKRLKILQRLGSDGLEALVEAQLKLKLLDEMAIRAAALDCMTNMYVIYALIDPRDNCIRYIGQSKQVSRRYRDHIRQADTRKFAKDCWIVALLRKRILPDIIVLSIVPSVCNVDIYERAWIAYAHGESWPLLNLTDGGREGYTLSSASKQKLAKVLRPRRGNRMSKEARLKLSRDRTGSGNPMYGVKQSKESHAKRIATWRSRVGGVIHLPESSKDALRKAMTGRKFTDEHRQKLRDARRIYLERKRCLI